MNLEKYQCNMTALILGGFSDLPSSKIYLTHLSNNPPHINYGFKTTISLLLIGYEIINNYAIKPDNIVQTNTGTFSVADFKYGYWDNKRLNQFEVSLL
jgi:hypothetical protein